MFDIQTRDVIESDVTGANNTQITRDTVTRDASPVTQIVDYSIYASKPPIDEPALFTRECLGCGITFDTTSAKKLYHNETCGAAKRKRDQRARNDQ